MFLKSRPLSLQAVARTTPNLRTRAGFFMESNMKQSAIWTKGKRSIKGLWWYNGNEQFTILLEKVCSYSGRNISFYVVGDKPEFNGWKILRSDNG